MPQSTWLVFALSLSALACLGCPSDPTGIDAALPGTFTCGPSTCAAGEICVTRVGPRGGVVSDTNESVDAGSTATCEPRPAACGSQGDCTLSSCDPACVDVVCMTVPAYLTAELMVSDGGRSYRCVRSSDAS